MKKIYDKLKIEIYTFDEDDVVRTSGEVDGDETKYPIPDGWGS